MTCARHALQVTTEKVIMFDVNEVVDSEASVKVDVDKSVFNIQF